MDSNETTVRVDDDGRSRVVHVNGPLDLPNAKKVCQALVESLGQSANTGRADYVSLDGLTRIDLSGLQLLCSSHRTAVSLGNNLKLADPPPWFHEVCSAAGFVRSRSTCPYRRGENCLWRD